MSEQYQEDSGSKKPTKVKHSFKKAFSRHATPSLSGSSSSSSGLATSSGSIPSSASPANHASILLDELINSLRSLYTGTKKQ